MQFDRQAVLWTTAIIVVTGCFLLLVTRPQFERMGRLTALLASERVCRAGNANVEESLAKLRREVNSLAAETADFDRRIPDQEKLGSFLEDLTRLARGRDLIPETVEPGAPVRWSGLVARPVAFKVRGPLAAVCALVGDLERMPRLTRIERFEARLDRDVPGRVSAALDLRLFSRAS